MAAPTTTNLAVLKRDVVDVTIDRIRDLARHQELHLPADYSAENALKAAWLILKDTVDKEKNPVLQVCDPNSISLALFNMVAMALNPQKKQCYFIAYGKKLVCQPSYFGDEAMAVRLSNGRVAEIPAEVVYEGDTLKYKIVKGKKVISDHEQSLENINSGKIVAAYAIAISPSGQEVSTVIMTMADIKASWKKSKQYPMEKDGSIKAGSTHGDFTEAMCKRTVIRKCAKPFINTSDDKYLKIALEMVDGTKAEEDLRENHEKYANQGEVIEILVGNPALYEATTQTASAETGEMVQCPNDPPGDRKLASFCNTNCGKRAGCPAFEEDIPVNQEAVTQPAGKRKPGF